MVNLALYLQVRTAEYVPLANSGEGRVECRLTKRLPALARLGTHKSTRGKHSRWHRYTGEPTRVSSRATFSSSPHSPMTVGCEIPRRAFVVWLWGTVVTTSLRFGLASGAEQGETINRKREPGRVTPERDVRKGCVTKLCGQATMLRIGLTGFEVNDHCACRVNCRL